MRYRIVAFLMLASAPVKAEDGKSDCAIVALMDYTKQNLALLQSQESQLFPSIEATIAKRRLQESYCLRSTQCLYGTEATGPSNLTSRIEFSKCLDEEAQQGK